MIWNIEFKDFLSSNMSKQMKHFRNLMKSSLGKNTTCGFHNEKLLPDLKPLEYCNTCKISICYTCGNNHIDLYHDVEWGLDVFDDLTPSKQGINERFNTGYPILVELEKLKCPCGNHFLDKSTSTICVACGSATCSAECHENHLQSNKKCLYINNFNINEKTKNIQGLRNIKAFDIINAYKYGVPFFSPISISNSKFMKALMSPNPLTIILQRGFRQYGQPHDNTLNAMIEFTEEPKAAELFENHTTRLCMCECDRCNIKSPHPIYNCYKECREKENLSEYERIELGLYKKCMCFCQFCIDKKRHITDDCINGCELNSFRRH